MSVQKKIIISSAVPLNNGDAALVFSLADALSGIGFQISFSTYHYALVKSIYHDRHFIKEITDFTLFRKLPQIKKIAVRSLFGFKRAYRNADAFIAAPGGYLNDYYGFAHTLELLRKAKLSGKKTGIYAQSVGPVGAKSISLLLYYQQFIDLLLVRDIKSAELLREIGYNQEKFLIVEDGAFLLKPYSMPKQKTLHAAISVRAWKHDNRNSKKYISLIIGLVTKLVENGYQITFLSTCQGLEKYTNDALMAQQIVEQMPEAIKSSCTVDAAFYPFEAFRERLNDFNLVVGTRLHMCILSLLAHVPAFNISYEFKGRECYQYLDVPELSCDYNAIPEEAVAQLEHLLAHLPSYRKKLKEQTRMLHKNSHKHLDVFIEMLGL